MKIGRDDDENHHNRVQEALPVDLHPDEEEKEVHHERDALGGNVNIIEEEKSATDAIHNNHDGENHPIEDDQVLELCSNISMESAELLDSGL